MKRSILTLSLSLFLLSIVFTGNAHAIDVLIADLTSTADCSLEGSPDQYYWTKTWTDTVYYPGEPGSSETTYKMEAPCKVYLDDRFEVKLTVTDSYCSSSSFTGTVADVWWFKDTPFGQSTVTVETGNSWSNDINVYPSGTWARTYLRDAAYGVDHTLEFYAKDMGKCWGSHNWTVSSLGDVVVDPVRPSVDITPPELAPVAVPSIFWPANGKLNSVTITTNATDDSGGPLLYSASVTSNQGISDGDYVIDSIDHAAGVINMQILAKRVDKGDRVFTITVTATDEAGNEASADVILSIHHDTKKYD